jgi:hypothetical protein
MCVSLPLLLQHYDTESSDFRSKVLKDIGLSFEGHFAKVSHVAMGSISEAAGVRRGCRVVSVLPWGYGSACSKVSSITSLPDGSILPGVLQISSVDDFIAALKRCVESRVESIGLELRVYPYSSINTRRVALSAPYGECITSMTFYKGVLQHVETSLVVSS